MINTDILRYGRCYNFGNILFYCEQIQCSEESTAKIYSCWILHQGGAEQCKRHGVYNSAKLNVEGLPRYVKRTKVDNHVKLIEDDLLDLCACLDAEGCFDCLPTFVAQNLEHVPSVKLGIWSYFVCPRSWSRWSENYFELYTNDYCI